MLINYWIKLWTWRFNILVLSLSLIYCYLFTRLSVKFLPGICWLTAECHLLLLLMCLCLIRCSINHIDSQPPGLVSHVRKRRLMGLKWAKRSARRATCRSLPFIIISPPPLVSSSPANDLISMPRWKLLPRCHGEFTRRAAIIGALRGASCFSPRWLVQSHFPHGLTLPHQWLKWLRRWK